MKKCLALALFFSLMLHGGATLNNLPIRLKTDCKKSIDAVKKYYENTKDFKSQALGFLSLCISLGLADHIMSQPEGLKMDEMSFPQQLKSRALDTTSIICFIHGLKSTLENKKFQIRNLGLDIGVGTTIEFLIHSIGMDFLSEQTGIKGLDHHRLGILLRRMIVTNLAHIFCAKTGLYKD